MKPITPSTPLHELPFYLTVPEVCVWTRLSKNTVYGAIHSGRIASRRFGERKTLVPREALATFQAAPDLEVVR